MTETLLDERTSDGLAWITLYERTSDGLAWITLNRSDALNAINMQMPHVILSAAHFCFAQSRPTRSTTGWGIRPHGEVGVAMTCPCRDTSPALNAPSPPSEYHPP